MIAPAGVDKYLPKSGVWTTREDAHNVVDMRYSVSQRRTDGSETWRRNVFTEAGMESKTQVTYILIKFNERNTDRQVSSSVEVEKTKIERSEAEGTHMADRETISLLRAVATLRSQSGNNDKGSEQRSWWPVMTLQAVE